MTSDRSRWTDPLSLLEGEAETFDSRELEGQYRDTVTRELTPEQQFVKDADAAWRAARDAQWSASGPLEPVGVPTNDRERTAANALLRGSYGIAPDLGRPGDAPGRSGG